MSKEFYRLRGVSLVDVNNLGGTGLGDFSARQWPNITEEFDDVTVRNGGHEVGHDHLSALKIWRQINNCR